MSDIRGDQFRDVMRWVQSLTEDVSRLSDNVADLYAELREVRSELTDRLAAAESKIGRLLQAAETEPPRGPYLVRGCVGGTEHDWHTVEQGATFWCPECDAKRPARA